jgi:hypothetical protein
LHYLRLWGRLDEGNQHDFSSLLTITKVCHQGQRKYPVMYCYGTESQFLSSNQTHCNLISSLLQACYHSVESEWISRYRLLLNRWSDSWHIHEACSLWYLHAATSDATRLVARISCQRECENMRLIYLALDIDTHYTSLNGTNSVFKTTKVFT